MLRAVGQRELDPLGAGRLADARGVPPGDPQIVGLGHADAKEDGIDLRDRRQERALAAPDEVAGFHVGRAASPAMGDVMRV